MPGKTRNSIILTFLLTVVGPVAASARPREDSASLHGNIAWQIALERVGFSPGVIDGSIGPKTRLATQEFQRVRGLVPTGRLDAATAAALQVDEEGAVTFYAVTQDDLAEVGPAPKNWKEKSKLPKLGYESIASAVAERFHCSVGLLRRLNGGPHLLQLRPGIVLQIPAVSMITVADKGTQMEINLREKVIRVMNRERKLIALFHCSIAKDREKLPSGDTAVVVITENPKYTFDPKMWPEVKGVDRKLLIPPGPRNPVGRCWIGLSLPGYGIHGSPNPELIGKTGSHGCFRLTNWDALRLARMIRIGTNVRFVGQGSLASTKRRNTTALNQTVSSTR